MWRGIQGINVNWKIVDHFHDHKCFIPLLANSQLISRHWSKKSVWKRLLLIHFEKGYCAELCNVKKRSSFTVDSFKLDLANTTPSPLMSWTTTPTTN